MVNSPHDFILAYIKLLKRHSFLKEIAITIKGSEKLVIQILTLTKCIQMIYFEGSYLVDIATKNMQTFNFTDTPRREHYLVIDYGQNMPKTKTKLFSSPSANIGFLIRSIGATVVAPSNFHVTKREIICNQGVKH